MEAGTVTADAVTADDVGNAAESGETIALTGTATGGDISEGDTVSVTVNGVRSRGAVDESGNYAIDGEG